MFNIPIYYVLNSKDKGTSFLGPLNIINTHGDYKKIRYIGTFINTTYFKIACINPKLQMFKIKPRNIV